MVNRNLGIKWQLKENGYERFVTSGRKIRKLFIFSEMQDRIEFYLPAISFVFDFNSIHFVTNNDKNNSLSVCTDRSIDKLNWSEKFSHQPLSQILAMLLEKIQTNKNKNVPSQNVWTLSSRVRTSWLPAKCFPVQPSFSVNSQEDFYMYGLFWDYAEFVSHVNRVIS